MTTTEKLHAPAFAGAKLYRSWQLTESQQKVLRRVLKTIRGIADSEEAKENQAGSRREYIINQRRDTPSNVILVDGPRGAGKTSILLKLEQLLKLFGNDTYARENHIDQMDLVCLFRDEIDVSNFTLPHRSKWVAQDRKTALFAPIIFPEDMEENESTMEALISYIFHYIEDREKIEKEKQESTKKREFDGVNVTMKSLKASLIEDVASGFYLSRHGGLDAMIRDCVDFNEFINKRSELSSKSYRRVRLWRKFINTFLDFFDCELLVIAIDDTDVSDSITADILHTARIYLDHPRIVTVISGNLNSMRHALTRQSVERYPNWYRRLNGRDTSLSQGWMEREVEKNEEYLEKILPPVHRHFINFKINDESIILESPTFREFAHVRMGYIRKNFVALKIKAHNNFINMRHETENKDDRNVIDNFLAWWIIRHTYSSLRPKSIRHMRDIYDSIKESDKHGVGTEQDYDYKRSPRRVAWMFFINPENYHLIRQFGDFDEVIPKWLPQQSVRSAWKRDRYIEINGDKIYERTYSYEFLMFRLDLGLAACRTGICANLV